MTDREYSPLDNLMIELDRGLRTLLGSYETTERPHPAAHLPEAEMNAEQKRHAAGLMRVNHAGEVCAQGLYQGQALTAKLPDVRAQMERAALEENDHLAWCATRLQELDSHTSRLNPLWYFGSLVIGAAAGAVGDRWSLGFVAETERQVEHHLDQHLTQLPENDAKSQAIIAQMRDDEIRHGAVARDAGGAELPLPVRALMTATSKIMTTIAYKI
ncbi:MAG: 2-polyprenyl-3-methyl-6-methoxy-1,4-benzoquinone monooxygenase [Gammaproteobacteria bacterium]|nr:2-polyprenyl-3-methyl-6-methoxy-1,4-benzoquinone monooxygenase [Gammaproteobacteria bacterium]